MNFLRNVALNNTLAKYIFTIDVDFLPNKNLFEEIVKLVQNGSLNKKKVSPCRSLPVFVTRNSYRLVLGPCNSY